MKLTDILPNPENPRVLRDEKFAKLKQSIQDFPKMMSLRPIVIDNMGMILGGNMRYRALQELGFKEIPETWVKRAEELTAEEKRRFIIADNVGFGEWDWDELANNWNVEELGEWGLDVPNFEDEVLEAKEDDYEIPEQIHTDIVLGDLFEIGGHRLLCGDSTDVDTIERLTNGKKCNICFTDPPHDIEQDNFISFIDLFCSGTKFILHNDKYLAQLAAQYIERFERFFVHDFIFHIGGGDRFFTQNDLIACFDYDKEKYQNLHDGFSSVIRKMTERQKGTKTLIHPHQKPIYLIEQILKHFSVKGEIVIDFYLGSGTTMVTAHQLGMFCYGCEINEISCHKIIDRMLKLDPDLVVLKNGQPYSNIS
jgi:DNA modification methylase